MKGRKILDICFYGIIAFAVSVGFLTSNANPKDEKDLGLDPSNVVETFWYGTEEEGAWYVVYDYQTEGHHYDVIRVSQTQYKALENALEDYAEESEINFCRDNQ